MEIITIKNLPEFKKIYRDKIRNFFRSEFSLTNTFLKLIIVFICLLIITLYFKIYLGSAFAIFLLLLPLYSIYLNYKSNARIISVLYDPINNLLSSGETLSFTYNESSFEIQCGSEIIGLKKDEYAFFELHKNDVLFFLEENIVVLIVSFDIIGAEHLNGFVNAISEKRKQ